MPATVASRQVWLAWAEVIGTLQIPDADCQWLVNTGQLTPRLARNGMMFNSLDVWRLIQSYRDVAHRRGR
jgi:hypothetical protein